MMGPVEIDSKQEISNRRLVKRNVQIVPKKNNGTVFVVYTQFLTQQPQISFLL